MDIQNEARHIASLLRMLWGKYVPEHAVKAAMESARIAGSTKTAVIVVRPEYWANLEAAVREELTRSA